MSFPLEYTPVLQELGDRHKCLCHLGGKNWAFEGCDHTWPVLPQDYPKESSEVPTDRFILPLDATGHINHSYGRHRNQIGRFSSGYIR